MTSQDAPADAYHPPDTPLAVLHHDHELLFVDKPPGLLSVPGRGAHLADCLLVRVQAASVNFSDVMRRRGDVYPFPTAFPYTPGSEVAGTVEALGDGVDGPAPGTPAFAFVGADASGGYAEFALAQAHSVVPLPPGTPPEVACGLGVAGTTAMLVLREVARVGEGDTVVVPAAAGGVGGLAVQLAKHLGAARVVGLASTPEKRAHAEGLGADLALDPADTSWPDAVRQATDGHGADVVLEMTGGDTFDRSLSALAPFGRVVVYGMAGGSQLTLSPESVRHLFYDPSLNNALLAFNLGLWFGTRPQVAGAALREVVGLVASGAVRPSVGAVLPLSSAAEAHRRLEGRETTGKLVLVP